MRRHAKASSAGSTSRHGKSRGLFGLGCLCVLGLVAFTGSGTSVAPAAQSFPGQGFLPDHRAWEMVSPPDKNGGEISALSQRTHAASDGSAVQFLSLEGFADAVGSGVGFEYMAQRTTDPDPGDSGWSTHALTPSLESMTYSGNAALAESRYQGELSDDLTKGAFLAFSPLATTPPSDQSSVANAVNLYRRADLRTPGAGSYQLLSDCPLCASEGNPIPVGVGTVLSRPTFVSASKDFSHVIFESTLQLTADATGANKNAYESADGITRLVGVLPSGEGAKRSIAGRGSSPSNILTSTSHPISADGSRIFFTVSESNNFPSGGKDNVAGATYARINGRTTFQLNASERAVPDAPKNAVYWDASGDGARVFFTSAESLTEDTPINSSEKKLYMWKQAAGDEQQSLAVDAGGGTFKLTLATQPATAVGDLSVGSTAVKKVRQTTATANANTASPTSGAFSVGQEISGPGIAAGTTIAGMGAFTSTSTNTLTLSAPAIAGAGTGKALTAILKATTTPLSFEASAKQVQEALEALAPIGAGNVSVTGGPGSPGGATPYLVTFTGDLAGVNMPQLTADSSSLTGGGASTTVETTQPVENLTYLNVDGQLANSVNGIAGVIGASEDGHYVYFVANGQLVEGAPEIGTGLGIYLWHEGALSYVGRLTSAAADLNPMIDGANVNITRRESTVSPDGHQLFFGVSSGEGVLSAHGGVDYDQGLGGPCGSSGCREFYVYSADTDTLQCASCNPSGAAATAEAFAAFRKGSGGSAPNNNSNPRSLSADGHYAFFTTAEKLVGEDTNGVEDAYAYDTTTGKPHLLSSGESSAPSYFLEASADGKNAFFLTREQLSAWDTDQGYDLYDARVGGGFPEPPLPPPSCQGDACQPAPLVLNDPTPSSSSAQGPGNRVSNRNRKGKARCAKGHRKVKARNGKTRCVKQKQHKRHANSNRRAGR